ncbi:non-ribosomal peptide synthetase, partial [Paenibacillus kobensis]|uniref:non-ribosomal peptide synthetase n=1 Tax=Paenibacillus kobensis TaxID=59841 RepID=UPI0013E40F03
MNHYNLTLPQTSVFEMEAFGEGAIATVTLDMLVSGEPNFEIMTRAINKVIEYHDALRIRLDTSKSKVQQYVCKYVKQDISYKNFSSQEEYVDWAKSYAKNPLNTQGNLYEIIGIAFKDKFGVILKCHHLICDMWSMTIYLNQIFKYYQLLVKKQSLGEEKQYSYLSYISREQAYLKSKQYIKDKEYWNNVLDHHNIPTNISLKSVNNMYSERKGFIIDLEMEKQISEYCKENNISEFRMLLAVLGIYIYKRTNQSNLYIATTVLNRTTEEEKKTSGMFVNMVPIPIDVMSNDSVYENIRSVKGSVKSAFHHQKYNYMEFLRDAHTQHGIADRLTDVSFNYQNASFDKGYEFSWYHCGQQTESLSIHVRKNTKQQLEFYYDYHVAKFEEWEIDYFHKQYYHLLQTILQDDTTVVEEISCLTPDEFDQIIHNFNDTAAEYPSGKTVVGLFEEQVQKTPDNIAVVFEDAQLTYAQLNSRSNQLARELKARGVKADQIVGLMVERSLEMIVGILGILKAGGAYLPIDPTLPAERIRFMLADSGVCAVLKQKRYELSAEVSLQSILDLEDWPLWNGTTNNPDRGAASCDLAYVIYTSGTTGNPKGVMVEHHSVLNLITSLNVSVFPTSSRPLHVALVSPYYFDASIQLLFSSLLLGHVLYIVPEDVRTDGKQLLRFYNRFAIDISDGTPVHLQLLASSMHDGDSFDVKHLVIGGEQMLVATVRELLNRLERYPTITNVYGPTECCVDSLLYRVDNEQLLQYSGHAVPIGKPMANTKVFILDAFGQLQPIGLTGELCIAGEGLARGYLNRPELTEEKFVDNPFAPGERMYRSGDLARWLPDGNIEYVGRIDHQVKIRGYRIELGEIENQLQKHEMVKETVVLAQVDEQGQSALCAYVVADVELTVVELRVHLGKALPDYMIPVYFVQIERLPLTSNGKVDRKALPKPNGSMSTGAVYEAPRNEVEKKLATIWQDVLGIGQVGIQDNFFELGGDSIKAIRVVSKMREAGYELAVKDLMQLRIVNRIAEKAVAAAMETVEQGEVSGLVLLTPIQHAFFDCNYVKPHHFNQATMLYCEEGFNVKALKQSIEALVVHHDMLRSVYRDKLQMILPAPESKRFDWKEYELENSDNISQIVEQKSTELQSSIDLEQGPLMKVGLFHTADGDHLLLCLHHLVVDGVSWRILLEDLKTGYEQALQGKEVVLPVKTASYKDWAEALVEYSQSIELKQERKYWREICEQVKNGVIQGDLDGQLTEYAHMQIELEQESTRQLLYEAGKAYGTEINDLLLSALGMSVKQWKGQHYVAVDLEGHGREEIHKAVKIDRTVGWFTSIYPIVLEVSEGMEETIINTKEMLRRVPNHGIGYGVAACLGQDRWPDAKADLCFNYLGHMDHELGTEGRITASNLSCGSSIADENMPKQGITMDGSVSGGKLRFTIAYNKGRYSAQSIEQFCQYYVQSIQMIVQHCVFQKEVIKTASDFGAPNMNAPDFKQLTQIHPVNEISGIYSLTPMQDGMLYHKLVDEHSTGYVLQSKLRMKGEFQVEKARESLSLLARKYDVLRTAFIYNKVSKPWQIILREREIECNVIDLSFSEEKENEIMKVQQADIRRGFNLEEDSLLRATILRKSEEEHILLWSSHHIIMDGWSLPLLFQDFMKYYETLTDGRALSSLQERVRAEEEGISSYGEYIRWLEKQDREEGLSYWENVLADYNEAAEILPQSQSRSVEEQVKEEVYITDIQLTGQLQRLSSLINITINTLVETAWGVLLQKYNRNTDVVFGKVVSGRNAAIQGIEQAVGLFINTIPIRVKCEESTTVEQLLGQVQQQAVASMEYDRCSLAEVQSRSTLGNHLIRTLFAFENYYVDESFSLGSHGLKIEIESAREQTNYDISLSAFIKEAALTLKIMYDPGKYGSEEIRKLLGRMGQLLQQMTANPKQKISELSVVDEEEKKLVIETFNDTAMEYSSGRTVVESFEEQVGRTPDNIAVVFEDAQLTYTQLNEKANQLAYKLRELGVRPDDRIAILAHRSIEMIIGIYGIMKAGGAYVPVDPGYPDNRIQYMLEDCQPKAILLGRAELPNKGDIPVIDLLDKEVYTGAATNPEHVNTPKDLMYVIYTSGTTGKPKGVMIEHRNVMNYVEWAAGYYRGAEGSGAPVHSSLAFDLTVTSVFVPLLSGKAVRLLLEGKRLAAEELADALRDKADYTLVKLTPAHLGALGHLLSEADAAGSARTLVIGGEQLLGEQLHYFRTHSPQLRLINEYGPTETTVGCCIYEVQPDDPWTGAVPIGRPIANARLYILDEHMQPVPVGVQGELYIGGAGVARGYLNRPELTAEKFVENPFGEDRMYRSGDLARWFPDGNIEYMGRVDEQVKIRGFRVELGEIESVLRKQPGVKDAAVTVKEKNGDKSICAYVVLDQEIRTGDIKDSLRKELPEYMVPTYIQQIDSIPLTRNGKLDKHALPEPEATSGQEYIAPRNEIEEIVTCTFAEVLGVTPVGIEDNFFELGGHSLRATRVVNQIEVKTGVRLPLKAIFAAPTARLLAKEVEEAKSKSKAKVYVPISQAEEKEVYPMSSGQKRLYLINQMDDAGIAYNMPTVMGIHGTLDRGRMKYALEQLAIRHEALRTSFHMQDGELVQKIAQEVQLELEYEERFTEKEEKLLHGFVLPFDLGKAPLMRMKAVKRGEDKTVLLLD